MKKILALALIGLPLLAGTRVLDVLYDARGNRANGVLFLEWPSFTSASGKAVAGSKQAVRVNNGIVDISLEPILGATPSGLTYTATFSLSGGSGSRVEQWAVPDSSVAVTLAQVRVNASGGTGGGSGSGGNGGGSSNVAFSDQETPVGVTDGTNRAFTLANAPNPASSLILFRNGIALKLGGDYTLSGNAVTFVPAATPQSGDMLLAWYRVAGSATNYSFADAEVPAGVLDGSNRAFTLAHSPNPSGSLVLFRNGIAMKNGADYSLSGAAVNFFQGAQPRTGDLLQAWYRY